MIPWGLVVLSRWTLRTSKPAMTGHLDISVHIQPSHVLVCPRGECDVTTAQELRGVLTDQTRLDAVLVVADLTGLKFLDAAGIHALLDARTVLATEQKHLILSSPQKIVSRVLKLTGAEQLIPIYPSLNHALAAH